MWISKSFNSTLVQLKAKTNRLTDPSVSCFNSTLVQLKGGFHPEASGDIPEFQFYLSSIKRKIIKSINIKPTIVSILP